jgi:murein DD-endopeptidase MepM/ murein hydrolase activator NlpD
VSGLTAARAPEYLSGFAGWRIRGRLECVRRFLALLAVAALGVSVVLPAAAFAEPETFAPTQTARVPLTPQSLVAQQGESAPVIRDTYTVELPKPVQSVGFSATAIAGLLTTWPCSGPVNDGYGDREGGFHYGIDIMCGYGAPVVASAAGVVLEAEMSGSWGQYVKIDHGNGVATLCAHMIAGSPTVVPGQPVAAGEVIGAVGDTGNTTAPHCHFEVWVNGSRVDPIPWLP